MGGHGDTGALRGGGRADSTKQKKYILGVKQRCRKCGKELKDGDPIRAVVVSVYREISSSVSYAIEKPSDCLSIEHLECGAAEEPDL
jgi:hypothetical protein